MPDAVLVSVVTNEELGVCPAPVLWLVFTGNPLDAVKIVIAKVGPLFDVHATNELVETGLVERMGLHPGEACRMAVR